MLRLFLFAVIVAGCASPRAVQLPPPAPGSAGADTRATEISEANLRRDLVAFAADSFRGRETGTPDLDRAARFLADRLRALGAEPAGDSGYFQRVPLTREYLGSGTTFSVSAAGRATGLAVEADLMPLIRPALIGLTDAGATKRDAQGEVVFLGYALKTATRDDFAGLDLGDKVVVFVNGAPPGSDVATRQQLESLLAIAPRMQRILPQRPAAVIVLMPAHLEPFYRQIAVELRRLVSPGTPSDTGMRSAELPMILAGVVRPGSPLLPESWPSDDRAQLLARRRLTAHVDVTTEAFSGVNVVAIVRGSDPLLNRSYVALGAHHDHIGIQPSVNGDSIANGADDNGSASVALLEIARSLISSTQRPRRSILFVWHDGEEKGLLGSAHFVERPTVPLDSIVAEINADMIGRNGGTTPEVNRAPDASNSILIVGPGAAPNDQGRILGQIVDSVNARQAAPFRFNRELDVATHPVRAYYRSDHYSYAKKGIPVVMLTTGLHEDYHRITDESPKIDYAKMACITTLMRDIAIAVANRATRLR